MVDKAIGFPSVFSTFTLATGTSAIVRCSLECLLDYSCFALPGEVSAIARREAPAAVATPAHGLHASDHRKGFHVGYPLAPIGTRVVGAALRSDFGLPKFGSKRAYSRLTTA